MCCHGIKVWQHKGSETAIQYSGHDIVNYKERAVGTVITKSFFICCVPWLLVGSELHHTTMALVMLRPVEQPAR